MARTLLMAAMVGAVVLTSPATSAAPVAAGEICDLKISLNGGPPVDGGFEFYRREGLFLSGSGWPLETMLDLRVTANGVEVHEEELPVQSDGSLARVMDFIGFLVDDADAPADMTITASDPADPGTCSDVVDLVRLPDPPFDDIVFDPFRESIIWLHGEGLVAGCRPALFCGSSPVTRAQMAVLLVRAVDPPTTTEDFFTDDDGKPWEYAINQLAAAGIVVGCAPGFYCPSGIVSREQMASFLVAAFELAPSDTDRFTDDDGSSHESAINALAAAGITTGCSSTQPERFCPDRFVSRGQMAAFLYRALQ